MTIFVKSAPKLFVPCYERKWTHEKATIANYK